LRLSGPLAAQVWPDGLQLRVRIALHTAEAQLRDEGNYFGVALSRWSAPGSVDLGCWNQAAIVDL